MNRKIKFRGFVLETEDSVLRPNVWVYGDLLHNQRGLPSETIYVDPESVGEFTGMQDSEEKDIYEGDVLEGLFDQRKYEVVFDCGCFSLKIKDRMLRFSIIDFSVLKIIGNIYQNPELI